MARAVQILQSSSKAHTKFSTKALTRPRSMSLQVRTLRKSTHPRLAAARHLLESLSAPTQRKVQWQHPCLRLVACLLVANDKEVDGTWRSGRLAHALQRPHSHPKAPSQRARFVPLPHTAKSTMLTSDSTGSNSPTSLTHVNPIPYFSCMVFLPAPSPTAFPYSSCTLFLQHMWALHPQPPGIVGVDITHLVVPPTPRRPPVVAPINRSHSILVQFLDLGRSQSQK